MEIINFLAELIGFSLVIFSLWLLFYSRYVEDIFVLIENETFRFFLSFGSMIFAIAILVQYTDWSQSWKPIMSAFAWILVIKAFMYRFNPQLTLRITQKIKLQYMDKVPMALVATIIVGCIFIYFGFTG